MKGGPRQVWELLEEGPPEETRLVLLRHGAREEVLDGLPGDAVPLTEEGREGTRRLGARLGVRLHALRTSPVKRCVETALALAHGAGVRVPIGEDPLLGGPGVYVEDAVVAGSTWRDLGHAAVMARLIAGERMPGLADPVAASHRLVAHLREVAGGRAGIHVFVTHDSVVAPAAAHLLGRDLEPADWPGYLEGVVVTSDEAGTAIVRYRDWTRVL